MRTHFIKFDLLEAFRKNEFQVMAHQVNCLGIMGSGVAAQIKKKYPNVDNEYVELVQSYEQLATSTNTIENKLLGFCQIVKTKDGFVANLFGQNKTGIDKQQTEYHALRKSLIELRDFMTQKELISVGFPDMIGCGLGGGDRETVLEMITDIFNTTDISIYFYRLV